VDRGRRDEMTGIMADRPPSRPRPARHRILAILLTAATLLGCAAEPPKARQDVSMEEREEFLTEILADLDKVDTFLHKTQRGVNLSEFSLGWFAMILLNELCSQDQELFDHIHADGRNVEGYLRTVFQNAPTTEIVIMGALARKGNRAVRLAARHTLEMLITIPDSKEPAGLQAQSRKGLIAALTDLKTSLTQLAAEMSPQPYWP